MIVMAKNKSDQKRRIENVLSALKHDKLAIASLVFLVIIIALALLAPILPLDPNTTDVRNMFSRLHLSIGLVLMISAVTIYHE